MPWFVLYTHPKCEKLARDQCINQGFETFLPSYTVTDPKKGEIFKPLFPSYVFVKFDPEQDRWFPLCNTVGVKKLISSYPQLAKKQYGYIKPTPVPDTAIASLQQQVILSMNNKTETPVIRPGLRVKVLKGVLADKEGICTWSNDKRVKLLMSVLNGQIEVSFSSDTVGLA